MAENINIGNTPDGRFDRELELYSAFSEVEDKYVDEMLDDAKASRIRAEHRRRTVRIRGSIAACAAVIAIVIGIGVIPRGRLESARSSESAVMNDAAPAKKNNEAAKSDNAGAENTADATSDEEPMLATTTASAPEVSSESAEEMMEAAPTEEADERNDDYREDAKSDDGDALAENDKTPSGNVQSLTPDKKDEASAAEETDKPLAKGDHVTLKDGSGWYVGEVIGEELFGDMILSDRPLAQFRLRGFDDRYITAMIDGGGCRALITDDFNAKDLAELAKGLGFKKHLHCEKYYGSNGEEEISEEMFRGSILKLITEHGDRYELDPTFSGGTGTIGNYICWIGDENDRYISDVYITVSEDAVIVTCCNATAMFVEKGK